MSDTPQAEMPKATVETKQLVRQRLCEKQLEGLTQTQEQAVRAAAQGTSARALAEQQGVSVRSVEDSRIRAMRRLKVKDFKTVVRLAVGAGWGNTLPPLEESLKLMESLSPRERQTIDYMVKGDSTKDVGEKLSLSPRTIEMHYQHAMSKLGISRLPDLMGMVQQLEYHGYYANAETQSSGEWQHPAFAEMVHATAGKGVERS